MDNYFIIHGSFGNPYGNWFRWLHDFIESEGKEVYVPDFPIGVNIQNYDNWKRLLKVYVDIGLINENSQCSKNEIIWSILCYIFSTGIIKMCKS